MGNEGETRLSKELLFFTVVFAFMVGMLIWSISIRSIVGTSILGGFIAGMGLWSWFVGKTIG